MLWTDNREHWDEVAREVDPSIVLHSKGARWALLGRSMREDVVSVYANHVFIPTGSIDMERAVWHEGRHVYQQRWFGAGLNRWLGWLAWKLLAVLVLPVWLTVRSLMELDAERYSLQRKVSAGSDLAWAKSEMMQFSMDLSTASYLWAMPRWLAMLAGRIWADKIQGKMG